MYEGQNYKINKKIHDEVDKNQKYYEQEESGQVTTIKIFISQIKKERY